MCIRDREESINPPDFYHSPLTTLVCIENTTNKGGGACYDLEEIKKIKQVCDNNNLGLHLDGARLWNALVATGTKASDYGELFDSISVCLSKGLGAPMGSVLIGKQSFMDKAMRVRKVLGGGMRQMGYMAAAGIYALDNHIDRMEQDHKKTKELEEVLKQCDFVSTVEPVDTNILIFNLKKRVNQNLFIKALEQKEIFLSDMGQGKLRIVTHLDYTDEAHSYFCEYLLTLNATF